MSSHPGNPTLPREELAQRAPLPHPPNPLGSCSSSPSRSSRTSSSSSSRPTRRGCRRPARRPPDDIERVENFLGLDRPVYVQYWRVHEAARRSTQSLGTSFATARTSTTIVGDAAPGDRLARLRRRRLLDADRAAARHPLGAAAAVAVRPSSDGVRPDRHLGAPGLDRADLRRTSSATSSAHADHRVLRRHQPRRRTAAGPCSGLPP